MATQPTRPGGPSDPTVPIPVTGSATRPARPARRGLLAALLALLTLALAATVLAACSTATWPAAPAPTPPAPGPGPVPGYTISIPSLGVSSSLVGLGLNPDRSVEVPPLAQPMQAGVYTKGPMPGRPGPAVVLAHVNANGHPGFGAGFSRLATGSEIDVTTPDGPVRYRVVRTDTVAKSRFPTAAVYSDTPDPELRLITCGGALDRSSHNYLGQTIVWAVRA